MTMWPEYMSVGKRRARLEREAAENHAAELEAADRLWSAGEDLADHVRDELGRRPKEVFEWEDAAKEWKAVRP